MGRDPKRIFQEGEVHTISYSLVGAGLPAIGPVSNPTPPTNPAHHPVRPEYSQTAA